MSELNIEFKFSTYTRLMAKHEHTILGDTDRLAKIQEEATRSGLKPAVDHRVDRHDGPPWIETDAEVLERQSYYEKYPDRAHKIPPFGAQEIWDIVTVTAVYTTAFTVFLRNVVGIIKDTKDLTKNLTIKAKIGEEEVSISTSEELQTLIDRLSKQKT